MKVLHILKQAPEESTKRIIELQTPGNDAKIVELYKGGVSYERLIADVFAYDKVICW